MKSIWIILFANSICCYTLCLGQNATYSSKQFNSFFSTLEKGTTKFSEKENRLSKKYFKKYLKAEKKINRKLCKVDPVLADYLFSYSKDPLYYHSNYEDINQHLFAQKSPRIYIPTIDTLNNALEYFDSKKDSLGICNDTLMNAGKLNLKLFNDDMIKANDFQKYLRERKINLKETLSKYPQLDAEVLKLDKLNYYFLQFSSELKKEFMDKIKVNDFYNSFVSNNIDLKKYMDFYSQLSSQFKIPSDWGSSLTGLQKNVDVKSDISNTIATQGGVMDVVKKELTPMYETINKIKSTENLTNIGDVPSFKPSELKSEPILERFHFGMDYQVDKTVSFYPSLVSITCKVGLQISSRVLSGLGFAYSINLGEGWSNRTFKEQNKRSFAYFDYKILRSIYFESSFEKNLEKRPKSKEIVGVRKEFFDSILVGFKFKKKIAKRLSMTLSLLYDIKNSNQINSNSPIVYRFGLEY